MQFRSSQNFFQHNFSWSFLTTIEHLVHPHDSNPTKCSFHHYIQLRQRLINQRSVAESYSHYYLHRRPFPAPALPALQVSNSYCHPPGIFQHHGPLTSTTSSIQVTFTILFHLNIYSSNSLTFGFGPSATLRALSPLPRPVINCTILILQQPSKFPKYYYFHTLIALPKPQAGISLLSWLDQSLYFLPHRDGFFQPTWLHLLLFPSVTRYMIPLKLSLYTCHI